MGSQKEGVCDNFNTLLSFAVKCNILYIKLFQAALDKVIGLENECFKMLFYSHYLIIS